MSETNTRNAGRLGMPFSVHDELRAERDAALAAAAEADSELAVVTEERNRLRSELHTKTIRLDYLERKHAEAHAPNTEADGPPMMAKLRRFLHDRGIIE